MNSKDCNKPNLCFGNIYGYLAKSAYDVYKWKKKFKWK